MKRSNRLILLIGVFLAVVAFVLILLTLDGNPPGDGQTGQPTPPPPLPTVIAAQDIALGARITEDMLTVETLPVDQRLPGAYQTASQVVGQIVRVPVTTGQQITTATFSVGSFDQPVITVPEGQRAMSLQIDAVSGVGTIINTGDFVDVIIGFSADAFPVVEVSPDDGSIQVVPGLNPTSVKLIIEGVQVLGVVRQPPAPPAEGAQPTPTPSGPSQPSVSEGSTALVIVSLNAQQTEVLKFAQMSSSISLALRSSDDFFDENGEPELPIPAGTTGIVLKTLVDGGYGVLRPELIEAILPEEQQ